jgi:TolB-like protein
MKQLLFISIFCTSFMLADTKTVAISYFDNTSGTEEYNPLSKGLADMLITDLSNVKSIQIVEREKLESLLKEIDLGEGKFIDPNTAQKLGKGLGAGYMLTGSFLIMGETMRIDARLVDVGTGEISMAEEITGSKNTFFELEKDLVNKLVASLNLGLSKSEERRIKKVQTESFESFSAYSSSLDALDNGRYEESVEYLKKTVEYDEDFEIAWDKLDDLQEKLDKLVKARSLNLTAATIETIDKAFSTRNQADVEMMLRMLQTKLSECYWAIVGFEIDSENNSLLSEKFISDLDDPTVKTVDDYKLFFVNKFNQYISSIIYLDSKKFDSNLGGEKNPFKLAWTGTVNYMESFIGFFLAFEESYGADQLTIIDSNGDEKPAYQVLDDLIIDHGNKLLNAFPYTNDAVTKLMVERAILRRNNPDIYSAHKWISGIRGHTFTPYISAQIKGSPLGSIELFSRIRSTTISKEVLHGITLIPGFRSSKPGGIKELHFRSLYKEQYKLMQEYLPGIKITVKSWEDDLRKQGTPIPR